MKAALFQQDIVWGSPESNRRRLDGVLESAQEAELYVFPEMFTTGFATEEDAVVEESDAAAIEWMLSWSRRKNAAIAGSVALRNGKKCVNRLLFVTPDGKVVSYDKRHLFSYGGEDRRFCAGRERVIAEAGGCRFLLAVCYDLRFPVWLRNRGDYDAILLVANWPDVRMPAWDTLSRARAIENQCYVLACNRVGKDPACNYSGGTRIINPYGETVSEVPDATEGWACGNIDMDFLCACAKKFPVLESADSFEMLV